MSPTLVHYLVLSGLLFSLGAYGVIARRNMILVIMSIEVMLNAVNVSLVAFSNNLGPGGGRGSVFVLFIFAVAASEVAIGLALVIANYRLRRTVHVDELSDLQG